MPYYDKGAKDLKVDIRFSTIKEGVWRKKMPEYYKGTPCDYCNIPIQDDIAFELSSLERKALVHSRTTLMDDSIKIGDKVDTQHSCHINWIKDNAPMGAMTKEVVLKDKLSK